MFSPDEEKFLASGNGCNPDCSRKWKCKDGRVMLIAEMDNQHLVNSILLVQHRWPWRSEYYHCLIKEAQRRNLI